MAEHTINFDGIEMTVIGTYEKPEDEIGYKGGWSTDEVKIGDYDVTPMLTNHIIELISDQVLNENY